MIVNVEKNGNKLKIEIPLNQLEITHEKVARYVIALYEFEFIPPYAKCFITADVENNGLTFCVKPNSGNGDFERTYKSLLYKVPSAAFDNALKEAGFEVVETSQMSWKVFKK